MSKFDWSQFPEAKTDAFNWDAHPVVGDAPHENKFNAGQAAVMHGLNSATGGFSDELQGVGEAAGRMVGVQGAGGPMKNMGLSLDGPTLDWETLRDAYKAARDRERNSLKQQSEEHPVASGAADIVGAMASPINKVASGMSLAKGGALLGGITGAGRSEAEDLGGLAADTTTGSALGFGLGGAADKVKSLGPGIKNAIDDVATAPLGAEGERGMAASLLDKVHRAGKWGNEKVDDLAAMISPKTGNDTADSMLKGMQRLGRYGVATKGQIALDAAEKGPEVAQWAAGKASKGIDKLSGAGSYADELAKRSPQVYQMLKEKMTGSGMSKTADNQPKPYDKDEILQKTNGTKYGQALQNAAQRGDKAFNAAYFVLQNNPDFRQSQKDENDQNEDSGT